MNFKGKPWSGIHIHMKNMRKPLQLVLLFHIFKKTISNNRKCLEKHFITKSIVEQKNFDNSNMSTSSNVHMGRIVSEIIKEN